MQNMELKAEIGGKMAEGKEVMSEDVSVSVNEDTEQIGANVQLEQLTKEVEILEEEKDITIGKRLDERDTTIGKRVEEEKETTVGKRLYEEKEKTLEEKPEEFEEEKATDKKSEEKRDFRKTLLEKYMNNAVKEDSEEFNFEEMYTKTFGDVPVSLKKKELSTNEMRYADNVKPSLLSKEDRADYKYIGTAFSTYIMLEIANDLYLLDQHAAHERILYEKVKKNFYSNKKDSQLMLLPDIIVLTNKEYFIMRENQKIFEEAGFIIEEFGDNTIKLVGVPNMCIDLDTKILFLDILDEIDTVARTERQEIEEKFIATIACKAAVKAKSELDKEEIIALLEQLMKLRNPFTCPHGRPTAIKLSKVDIEKKFSRR